MTLHAVRDAQGDGDGVQDRDAARDAEREDGRALPASQPAVGLRVYIM